MDFFGKLGKKASEAYKVTADKTGKLAKEASLRLKISDLKSQINDIYGEIGKKVYEKHVREEEVNIKADLEEECSKIDILSAEIESKLQECLELKNKRVCQNCYKEIDKDTKFCPECGAKQEVNEENSEIEVKEVEVLDNNSNINTDSLDNDSNIENNSEVEKSSEDDVKENLQKTVEVESNLDSNEDEEAKKNESFSSDEAKVSTTNNIESEVIDNSDNEEIDIDEGYDFYANEEDEKNNQDD